MPYKALKDFSKFHWKSGVDTGELSMPMVRLEIATPGSNFKIKEFESHHRHAHCKFLYWYQKFLCPVEPLYFSDEKSITVEK